jgi:cobalamin biosynthesis Mg chelatase CobN
VTPPGRANANRTIFGVAAPNVPAPQTDAPAVVAAPAESPRAGASPVGSAGAADAPAPGSKAAATAKAAGGKSAGANKGAGKAARAGVTTASAGPPASASAASSHDEDRTAPTRPAKEKPVGAQAETAVSTYVGVGFVIGLALLGLYRLVMVFAN